LIIIVFVFLILCFVLLLGVSYRKNDEHEDRPEKAGNKGNRKWNWLRFPQKAQNENQHTSGEDLASTHSDSAATTNQGTAQEKSSDDQSKLDELKRGYRLVYNKNLELEKQNTELGQELAWMKRDVQRINKVLTQLSEPDTKRFEAVENRFMDLANEIQQGRTQISDVEEKVRMAQTNLDGMRELLNEALLQSTPSLNAAEVNPPISASNQEQISTDTLRAITERLLRAAARIAPGDDAALTSDSIPGAVHENRQNDLVLPEQPATATNRPKESS
jgi:Ca2+/Na+ antiporter